MVQSHQGPIKETEVDQDSRKEQEDDIQESVAVIDRERSIEVA